MAASNGTSNVHTDDGRLIILIVGAGIGGLTAAVGLRRQGHHVKIFDQYDLANETRAAIQLTPNCTGLLRRYGLVSEDIGVIDIEGTVDLNSTGETKHIKVVSPQAAIWQYPWQVVHGGDLHQALKELAIKKSGKGAPIEIFNSGQVIEINAQNASIRVENGDLIHGDVVLGADGIYSAARKYVDGEDTKPFLSGKNAFHWQISRKRLELDPIIAPICQKRGQLYTWHGENRSFTMYPCINNAVVNFVAIHPSNRSEAEGEAWSQGESKAELLKSFSSFEATVKALLSHVDIESLRGRALHDIKTTPKWVNGSLALLGDAAHPLLGHQSEEIMQAIEDAASLAVVLPLRTRKEEIPDRLKLYQQCRKARVSKIQQYNKLASQNQLDCTKYEQGFNMEEYMAYNFGHDEYDHSTQMLRKWQWAKKPNIYWRTPIGYGPANGPRQDVVGRPRDGSRSTFRTYSIKFNTSRTLLQNLLPTEQFTFTSVATVVQATFSCTTLDKMDWLGGGGYSHCGLYIHGVQYKKRNGSVLNGTHLSVLFESLSDPITTGREELGMPKLFCSIESKLNGSKAVIRMHWRGAVFGELTWNNLSEPTTPVKSENGGKFALGNLVANTKPSSPSVIPSDEGLLVYRYVPAVGQPGKADVEYACFVPNIGKSEERIVEVSQSTKNATFHFMTSQEKGFETIRHIADRLSEIPIFSIVDAKVESGMGVEDVGNTIRIE